MSNEEIFEALQCNVSDAVANTFKDKRSMPTKWIIIAEVMEEDGEFGLWRCASKGAKTWETLGMIESAKMQEWHAYED